MGTALVSIEHKNLSSGRVAAVAINEIDDEMNQQRGILRGHMEMMATARDFRRRGLAHNLIYESMQMFKEMGMAYGKLGADVEAQPAQCACITTAALRQFVRMCPYRKQLVR